MAVTRFWIVGTARNVGRLLASSIRHLHDVFSSLGETRFFVVESNSADDTVAVLRRLSREIPNFLYESLKGLPNGSQWRTTRLAACRNHYLDHLLQQDLGPSDLVVMADLDGVNSRLSRDGIIDSLGAEGWDVVTANQSGRYYDLWALRHPIWCPSDYRDYSEFLITHGYSARTAHRLSVRARQLRIGVESRLIEVDSAFGGLALYRPWVIKTSRYEGMTPAGQQVSEHVPFHLGAREAGAQIFINPRMINAHDTEHTNTLKLVRTHIGQRFRSVRNE